MHTIDDNEHFFQKIGSEDYPEMLKACLMVDFVFCFFNVFSAKKFKDKIRSFQKIEVICFSI